MEIAELKFCSGITIVGIIDALEVEEAGGWSTNPVDPLVTAVVVPDEDKEFPRCRMETFTMP
jgi:hypothetical protein